MYMKYDSDMHYENVKIYLYLKICMVIYKIKLVEYFLVESNFSNSKEALSVFLF